MSGIRTRLTLWAFDKRGSIGTIFGLCLFLLLAFAGAAIEYGRSVHAHQKLQAAADAAVLAAAAASLRSEADRIQAAEAVFSSHNLAGNAIPVLKVDGPHVSIRAQTTIEPIISQFLGMDTISIVVESHGIGAVVSTPATKSRACVLALQGSGVGLETNDSTIDANCGLYANSSATDAIDLNGPTHVTATFTCAVGGISKDSGSAVMPAAVAGCPVMSDPFTTLTAPSNVNAACWKNGYKAANGEVLSPGVYCNGLEVEGSATVTFSPGIYIIRNGQFKIGSSANVTGNNVFFYLTGTNSTLDWGSHAHVKFKGLNLADGNANEHLNGMLIWNPSTNAGQHNIGCHAESYLEGAFYSPTTGVRIGSNGIVGAAADWTVWVVKRLEIGSSSGLSIKTSFSADATPMPDLLSSDNSSGGMMYTSTPGASQVEKVRLVGGPD